MENNPDNGRVPAYPSCTTCASISNSPHISLDTGDDEILTVRDVAGILKVPVSWVYDRTRPRCSDPLPSFKMGKYLRFSLADLRAYIMRTKNRAIIRVEF